MVLLDYNSTFADNKNMTVKFAGRPSAEWWNIAVGVIITVVGRK